MKTLALSLAALSLLALLAVPAASATPRVSPAFCVAIFYPPQNPGFVYDVLRLAMGTTEGACLVAVGGANGGLDAADRACNFLVGHDCT